MPYATFFFSRLSKNTHFKEKSKIQIHQPKKFIIFALANATRALPNL